jgi:hypothetical protein
MSQTPFTNDFPPANPNHIFSNDIPGQIYDFPHGRETANALSSIPETSISSNHNDQSTPHDLYSLNIPGQETDLPNKLEINSYRPSSSQETSFTFTSATNDFSPNNQNLSEIFAGSGQRQSGELEINDPDSQRAHLTTAPLQSFQGPHTFSSKNLPSPSSPSSNPISPDRHKCPHCPRTFKRSGDVKRHEKVHIPDQRRFQCWQDGCKRRGRKGFYRRDKLRDHVKIVHGL